MFGAEGDDHGDLDGRDHGGIGAGCLGQPAAHGGAGSGGGMDERMYFFGLSGHGVILLQSFCTIGMTGNPKVAAALGRLGEKAAVIEKSGFTPIMEIKTARANHHST